MAPRRRPPRVAAAAKLGILSGVYIPVCLNILSILMFLRFGVILGRAGLLCTLGLLLAAYLVSLLTALSLSAVASNGEVRGGGAYYLISRSLGPEFGGSIGVLFYLSQVLNTALNVVGLVDCIQPAEVAGLGVGAGAGAGVGPGPDVGPGARYGLQTAMLLSCAVLALSGSAAFARAGGALLAVLCAAVASIPLSAAIATPFADPDSGVVFTGPRSATLAGNLYPTSSAGFAGLPALRDLFGILFPAASGILAGASVSGDLASPSRAIPRGTLWAMLTTLAVYVIVLLSLASSMSRESLLAVPDVIAATSLWPSVVLAGECAVTFFSALMGVVGSANLLQAMSRDRLLPGLGGFARGRLGGRLSAVAVSYALTQLALAVAAADLERIATLVSMGFLVTFLVMNLACFLLKVGSAPNFRPGFRLFSWHTAAAGTVASGLAMAFVSATYAITSAGALVFLFLLIHHLCPPKRWGDVSQSLIYHQVRKYLLRLRSDDPHVKFWRPQLVLLVNSRRRHDGLIQFCNALKKGGLYVLGHVIVADDFVAAEARLQQTAWEDYVACHPARIKAFVQLAMAPSITWGVRNLVLAAGLGGMRPNMAVIGFYGGSRNGGRTCRSASHDHTAATRKTQLQHRAGQRRGGPANLEDVLATCAIRAEESMTVTEYMTVLEDLALKYRLNVAVAKGFEALEIPAGGSGGGSGTKKWIDLWPIQMSAEVTAEGKSLLTTNFDTYTLILQLGYILSSVPAWRRTHQLRVMVFVEYEAEVEEERARVRALLEKLRIDAEVVVFWLACGTLGAYELIVNGRRDDALAGATIDAALADEAWWHELEGSRGSRWQDGVGGGVGSGGSGIGSGGSGGPSGWGRRCSSTVTMIRIPSHPLASPVAPHVPPPDGGLSTEPPPPPLGRWRMTADLSGVHRTTTTTTMDALSRLGVSIGMHTQHLGDEMLDEVDNDDGDGDTTAGEEDNDGSVPSLRQASSDESGDISGDGADAEVDTRRPLLLAREVGRRGEAEPYGTMNEGGPYTCGQQRQRRLEADEAMEEAREGEGGMLAPLMPTRVPLPRTPSATSLREATYASSEALTTSASTATPTPTQATVLLARSVHARPPPLPPTLPPPPPPAKLDPATAALSRPPLSRQSSAVRFSSRPVPEARVHDEDVEGGPTIMFAEEEEEEDQEEEGGGGRRAEWAARPGYSRQSSLGPVSRGGARSRMSSIGGGDGGEPLEDMSGHFPALGLSSPPYSAYSTYSAQSMSLSFNDLPSSGQYLILNELMRAQSGVGTRTAVTLTTLPVPVEGVGADEAAAAEWVRGVEVLCEGMGAVMLVLSNSLSVTVGL